MLNTHFALVADGVVRACMCAFVRDYVRACVRARGDEVEADVAVAAGDGGSAWRPRYRTMCGLEKVSPAPDDKNSTVDCTSRQIVCRRQRRQARIARILEG